MFSPEAALPSPLSATGMYFPGALTQPPLQSIAERRSGSGGEESEEDEEDEEGGWRAETLEQEQARGSHDETVLKTGYLWKKGERRKVGIFSLCACVGQTQISLLSHQTDVEEAVVRLASGPSRILQNGRRVQAPAATRPF